MIISIFPILLFFCLVIGFALGLQKLGFLRTCLATLLVFLLGGQVTAAVFALVELLDHNRIHGDAALFFFVTQLLLLGTVWLTVKLLPFFKNRE
jgi:hypothetical protein